MNVIIPLGGKGERFAKNGYTVPKPLINILDKPMIHYVLDNLTPCPDDNIFIIYNSHLDTFNFSNIINEKYPNIKLIPINDTKGAAETLLLGINSILSNYAYNNKSIILDCDTFYTEDALTCFRNSIDNMVFYTKNFQETPIYSYIELNENSQIIQIKEKDKISDNANTGIYAFTNIHELQTYCKYVLDNNITFNNEPYTSCVISEMIKAGIIFKGEELNDKYVFSLGTPDAVNHYIEQTHAFLFDLDGTLVLTDDIYYDVWQQILSTYNIDLTKQMFTNYIQGNNDKYVLNSLLFNINVSLTELSKLKDRLFIENIKKLKVVEGVYDIIKSIRLTGHKLCIVTNCNKIVAEEIIKYIQIEHLIDFIISSEDSVKGKPHSDPYINAISKYNIRPDKCIIFEDSKSGILSAKGVYPKLLIGIETIYNDYQLIAHGANVTIKNYTNCVISDLIHKSNCGNSLIKMIKHALNYETIILDNTKLKGGFIADVISFKTNDSNASYILKYENNDVNALSDMAVQLDLYEREYYFYTNISNKINIKIPIFFNLIQDDNFENCGIILENLTDKNYKINLNLNVESIDVSLKIVDRMASMHSLFWNKNLKVIYPQLKKSNDQIFRPFFTDFISKRYDLFKTKWAPILNAFQLEKCEEIFNNFSNIQQRFSTGPHLTFIHGDIKSPNIFYDVENCYEPYFIDWQHCAIGKGVQDLIFFIIESFDITHIKLVFNIMKNYYYKKLLEYGITNYTLEEYEQDIDDAISYIPFFTAVWFGTISQDELIDKNFPYFLISKMFYLIEIRGQAPVNPQAQHS